MINFTDLKVIVIGDSGTGKTSFTDKWTKNMFSDAYIATKECLFSFKILSIEQKPYRIQLFDITGQDQNQNITKSFAKISHGCIVMTDAVNVNTREK